MTKIEWLQLIYNSCKLLQLHIDKKCCLTDELSKQELYLFKECFNNIIIAIDSIKTIK